MFRHIAEHPNHARHLNTLAITLSSRYDRDHDISDLTEAIALRREAIQLTSLSDPNRASHVHDLGIALSSRYNRDHDISDLTEAIVLCREAVQLTSSSDPHRASRLSNLGTLFETWYDNFGSLTEEDVQEGIQVFEEVLRFVPRSDPAHSNARQILDKFVSCRN